MDIFDQLSSKKDTEISVAFPTWAIRRASKVSRVLALLHASTNLSEAFCSQPADASSLQNCEKIGSVKCPVLVMHVSRYL